MKPTRRAFLGTFAVFPLLHRSAAGAKNLDPHERLALAIAELKAATEAIDPEIKNWKISVADAADAPCRLIMCSFRF